MEFLKDYDCTINYHPGKANVVAYALSRQVQVAGLMIKELHLLEEVSCLNPRFEPRKVILGNIVVKSILLEHIKEAQEMDFEVQKWLEKVNKGEKLDFTLGVNGVLKFRNRVVVLKDEGLKKKILEEAHRSKYTVYPGGNKLYQDLKSLYCFHSSIQIAPYEELYGQKCRSRICWDEVGERKVLDPTTVPWIEEARKKVKLICQRIQTAQSCQKSYADNRRKDLEFAVGDQVFLKITSLKASLMAGKGKKLQLRFVGPYKILQRVGIMAYKLELPPSLSRIHNIFHMSMLKKYHPDPSHVLQPKNNEIDEALTYEEKPIKLLDRKVKEQRNKRIPLVKVLWKNHGLKETAWEIEEEI
ncbi:uncharacterized protein [Coffea arabica]|uniref:Tf2-1-like SH3-like domain-containing protein n=1 Tax=Coffea arabica TaxID=13443 RepID=A0ABM4W8J4_COFAR